jgi:hypothetical protein
MPCHDPFIKIAEAHGNEAVSLLCKACKFYPGILKNLEIAAWWKDHQEKDKDPWGWAHRKLEERYK